MIDNEQPHQELVKCVVVGDTAAGKTRLICARACNKRVSLSQLLNTHVPTVWAIDQYRMCKDVLERSWEVVDGVNVSLRLWDTFGDHEKDRRFAYGRSDVVLLCFSLSSRVSFRNCKAMWFPEIRQFCPQTPVLLVGCKNDLRFMYRDESYLSYFRERSPFVRPVRESDLVMPKEARELAGEFGVHYYEASVLTYFGVNAVFENAIRAALIARRDQRFWMTNLKKVQRPLLQQPFCPPMPMSPPPQVQASTYDENILWLYQQKTHTDVIFVVGSTGFAAHKFILAAASHVFYQLFTRRKTAVSDCDTDNGSTDSSTESSSEEAVQSYSDDEIEYLIKTGKSHRLSELTKSVSSSHLREYNSIFLTIEFERDASNVNKDESADYSHTIVTLSKVISSEAMAQCLQFTYTGSIDPHFTKFQELYQAAEHMGLSDLQRLVKNIQSNDEVLNVELKQRYKQKFRERLTSICLEEQAFTDIIFHLEDGKFVAAHRALLSARCDVMRAMFSGNFIEKNAKVIKFPNVSSDTFRQLLTFLYADKIEPISSTRCLDLIELANGLCLTRLINLVEKAVIDELNAFPTVENPDTIKRCLELLEPCQLHNADQLAGWCMIYLCINYNKLCETLPKSLKELDLDNQKYLKKHRWPPVWYIVDSDNYRKHISDREKDDKMLCKKSSNSKWVNNNVEERYHRREEYEVPMTVTWRIR